MTEAPRRAILLANLHGRLTHEIGDRGQSLRQWTDLPFEEAIAYFRQKRIVTPSQFKKLSDEAKRQAFSVAGLHTQHALHEAHQAIHEAIAEGLDQRGAIGKLRDVFRSVGMTSASPHHLETVFRTNVLGAYAEGHYAQAARVRFTRPFWRYRTVGDGRVRPAHAAMDGRIYAADNPIWDRWYPPNGFNCRCRVETLSRDEVKPGDVKTDPPRVGSETAEPDRGWAASPGAQTVAKRAEQRLDQAVRTKAVLQPPRIATTGKAVFSSPGDLGKRVDRELSRKLDTWSGFVRPDQGEQTIGRAFRETGGRSFEIADADTRVPRGSVRFELAIPSQFADSMAQMVRRIALDPRTAQIAPQMRFAHLVHYRAVAGLPSDATAIVGGGVTRHGMVELSIVTKDPQAIEALAELLADSEAGSGAAIRRAPEKAHLIIRGKLPQSYGYEKAYRNVAREGRKARIVFSSKPLAKMKSEPVHLTKRTTQDLE